MQHPRCEWHHLLFFIVLFGKGQSVKNDATELQDGAALDVVPDVPSNESLNRAQNGGRQMESPREGLEQNQVGCRELRSTKYISDGQCTSLNPVKELVCAGECLPTHLLPNWIGSSHNGRSSSRREVQEWRCVIDRTRTQRIRLQCQDGSSRTYRITVVTSCKCKRYTRLQNLSERHRPLEQAAHSEALDPAAHNAKRRREQETTIGPLENRARRQSD
ncbi:unnamed protein product [Arctogadus glacialis]